jgi:hypothetical protein
MLCPKCNYEMTYIPNDKTMNGEPVPPYWLCTRWTCGQTVLAEPRP